MQPSEATYQEIFSNFLLIEIILIKFPTPITIFSMGQLVFLLEVIFTCPPLTANAHPLYLENWINAEEVKMWETNSLFYSVTLLSLLLSPQNIQQALGTAYAFGSMSWTSVWAICLVVL